MTPEREKYLREDADWGTLPATKRLEVFAALDEERARHKQTRDHAETTKEHIVGSFETIWKNNEQIASLADGVQKLQAEARAKAFKQAMFVVMKLDFLPEKSD